jgi:hypothetical protein
MPRKHENIGEREVRLLRFGQFDFDKVILCISGYPVSDGRAELGFVFQYKGSWFVFRNNQSESLAHPDRNAAVQKLISSAA